jgi:alpha-mannosidase
MFPFPFENVQATYEIPYGSVTRSQNHGEEVPALRWANVNGIHSDNKKNVGCLLINDCKYGHSLDNNILRLTLIRSSFNPDPLPEYGNHTVRLALIPHLQGISAKDFMRLAAEFAQTLKIINTDIHSGELPASTGNLIVIEPDNIILTSIKKAEDSDNIIIRLIETEGKAVRANISFDPDVFGKIRKVTEIDLIERSISGSANVNDENSLSVDVPAYGITSVEVEM